MFKDFDDLKENERVNKQVVDDGGSRTKFGICKNKFCFKTRRHCSAYCQDCSDKHK